MPVKNLAIISADFPTPGSPHRGAFVRAFAEAVERRQVSCRVVKPIPVHRAVRELKGIGRVRESVEPLNISVEYPLYLSCGYSGAVGPWRLAEITQRNFEKAVVRSMHGRNGKVDAVYGHFAYAGGAAAVRLGAIAGLPSFIGVGESTFEYLEEFGHESVRAMYDKAAGVIAVSRVVARSLAQRGLVSEKKIGVFPNGVDRGLFRPLERMHERRNLGLPQDDFLVCFVGRLSEAKGANRLAQAVKGLKGVRVLFLGQGQLTAGCPEALHTGPVSHEMVSRYLAASDVFVLPTVSEGCSNAILEALASGLPVISSRGEFNDDILNDSVSLRIAPEDPAEIRAALIRLMSNRDLRLQMGAAARKWSEKFDIDARAARILAYMEKRINTGKGAGEA